VAPAFAAPSRGPQGPSGLGSAAWCPPVQPSADPVGPSLPPARHLATRGPASRRVPVPTPAPPHGWDSAVWHPRSAPVPPRHSLPPQPRAARASEAAGRSLPDGELRELAQPHIEASALLVCTVPSVDPCQAMLGGSRPRAQSALNLDQARVSQLNEYFRQPAVCLRPDNKLSMFRMAPACQSRLFVAPQVDTPLLHLLRASTSGLSRRAADHLLKALQGQFVGVMAQFRLAFHGTIMTRSMVASMVEATAEQQAFLRYQMLAHLEALDLAAKLAASIVASMRFLLLQLTRVTGVAARGLQSLPFSGEALFGPELRRYLDEATLLGLQAQQLSASSGAQSTASGPAAKKPRPRKLQSASLPAPPPSFPSRRGKGRGRGRGGPKGGPPRGRR
jgi:hypothetical protein